MGFSKCSYNTKKHGGRKNNTCSYVTSDAISERSVNKGKITTYIDLRVALMSNLKT